MKKLHLYFLLIISILGSNIIYSQVNENITYEDFNNFVLSSDKYEMEKFASERNQMVVKIYNEGNRQYLVTYRNTYNGKMIQGIYKGNKVFSFENYKVAELERRKRKEKERLENIEIEKKREEKRKRKIREEKIRKEKEKINKVRSDIFTRSSYGEKSNQFHYYFFLNGDEPERELRDKYIQNTFVINFIPNKEFISKEEIVSNEIEEIGILSILLKDDPTVKVFELRFGVKNLYDDSKIIYYVNGKESKYDFGLKGKRWYKMGKKPLNHLINFYSNKGNVYSEFSDNFKLPFNLSIKEFKNLNELSRLYKYLIFLNEQKYTGENKELINYTIIKFIGSDFVQRRRLLYYPKYSIEVEIVDNSRRKFSWVLKVDTLTRYEKSNLSKKYSVKYTFKKKGGELYREFFDIYATNDLKSRKITGDELTEISTGNYKYSSVMNSNYISKFKSIVLKDNVDENNESNQKLFYNQTSLNKNSKNKKLHESIKNYKNNVYSVETKKFIIRVDELVNGELRYSSWGGEDKNVSNKPSLILFNGQRIFEGSGGNNYIEFNKGNLKYVVWENRISDSGIPYRLEVFQNKKIILEESGNVF